MAAVELLRRLLPELKIRVINVVDLLKLQPTSEHPHGLADRDFDMLFTKNKPVVFAFHGHGGTMRQASRSFPIHELWPQAIVMTVQNGLGAEEVIGAHGDWPLLSSVTFMSGTRHADTHVDRRLAAL